MKQVLEDKPLRNQFGKAAKERVAEFTPESFKKSFMDAVENNEYYEI
jgi:hypothetical protein